jgi:pyrroloquinoline-quinone synthase
MSFVRQLVQELSAHHLLKHPFYQAWTAGALTQHSLREYSRQYFAHVAAFPRYLSMTHANCPDIAVRQVILDNLMDEERGTENHPELWLRFAEGLGESREAALREVPNEQTAALVDTFMGCAKQDWAAGLGALFAYEQQVPDVAASKIAGLKKFYGIEDARTLKFFEEHTATDTWHTQAFAQLLDNMTPAQQETARTAALSAAKALWGFLDGQMHNVPAHAC